MAEDFPALRELLGGRTPPWLARIFAQASRTGGAVLGPGRKVLLCVSGGKDSLFLSLYAAMRRRAQPTLELEARIVEWEEQVLPPGALESLGAYHELLGIPFAALQAPFGDGEFGCYPCSRKRRIVLFAEAHRIGAGAIAMGHHLDDRMVTALMNLGKHGRFESMGAASSFFNGKFELLRPLLGLRESSIALAAGRLGLPVVPSCCPLGASIERVKYARMVASLAGLDRLVRERWARALDGHAGGSGGEEVDG